VQSWWWDQGREMVELLASVPLAGHANRDDQ